MRQRCIAIVMRGTAHAIAHLTAGRSNCGKKIFVDCPLKELATDGSGEHHTPINRSLTIYPVSKAAPNSTMTIAAAVSSPRTRIIPAPGFALANRPASPRAPTASVAIAATVIAVPTPIRNVDATPIQNSPCASANTNTMIAPEHGLSPTATIALKPRLNQCLPVNSFGSGACA